jgi:hypothetical protein
MAKRKKELEEMNEDAKRLAEMMRGVRPAKRGGFHSSAKKAEKNVENRRKKREDLRGKVRDYNSGRGVD